MTGREDIHRVPVNADAGLGEEAHNVFSPHTVFRLKLDQSDVEACGEAKCSVVYNFYSYREEPCLSGFVCNKASTCTILVCTYVQ